MVGYKRNRSYKRKVTKETESITWPRVVLVRTTAIAQVVEHVGGEAYTYLPNII